MAPPTSLVMHAPLTNSTALSVGEGPVVFARSSIATFIQDGVLNNVSVNEARFENGAYFSEGERINVLLWSENLSASNWSWSNTGMAATDGTKGPDGVTDAFKVSWTSSLGGHSIQSNTISAFTGDMAGSFFYKASSGNKIQVRVLEAGGIDNEFDLDTSSDVVSSVDSNFTDINIEVLANGWRKLTFKFSGLTSQGVYSYLFSGATGEPSVASVYIFGVGSEKGASKASSYIKTEGTTETRAEDQLGYDAANWPTLDTQFTVAVDIENLSDGTVSGTVVSPIGINGTNDLGVNASDQFIGKYGGVSTTDVVTSTIAGQARSIITWDTATNQNLYTDTVLRSGPIASVNAGGGVTEIRIGRLGADDNNFFGHLTNLRIYSTALTQEEIIDELVEGSSTVRKLYRHSMPLTGRGMGGKHVSPFVKVKK